MAIERTYFCDGPANPDFPHPDGEDRCPTFARTAGEGLPTSFLKVAGAERPLHFCGWDCVLRYAATRPATEVVTLDD